METVGKSPTTQVETQKTYRIEHLPDIDVVENLDYSNQQDKDDILEAIRNNQLHENFSINDLLQKIWDIPDDKNYRRFYIKEKRESKDYIDAILNRPKSLLLSGAFSKEATYALVGVLNEIILSKKIKKIITSSTIQKLARTDGFTGIKFYEPIFALIHKESHEKYLIYRNIKSEYSDSWGNAMALSDLIKSLKKIFLQNNIIPNDLGYNQFIVAEQEGKRCLILLDVEAYTSK